MFGEYLYFSSFSDTMLKHARDVAGRLQHERQLDAQSLVIEIASNDGYLLKNFVAAGVPVLGIEPGTQRGARSAGKRRADFAGVLQHRVGGSSGQ